MHRDAAIARSQCQKLWRGKAGMSYVKCMAHGLAIDAGGRQSQESLEVLRFKPLAWHELPDDGAEFAGKLADTAPDKALDGFTGCGQHLVMGRIAHRLEREDKIIRCFVAPLSKGGRLEGAVVSAVDFDSGEPLAGVTQLLAVRQAFRIEVAAPGRVGLAADADADLLRSVHWFVLAVARGACNFFSRASGQVRRRRVPKNQRSTLCHHRPSMGHTSSQVSHSPAQRLV